MVNFIARLSSLRLTGALRAGLDPCGDDRPELLLRAGRRLTIAAGCPAPRDKILVVRVVLDDLFQRPAAIPLRIFDLLADLPRALADPRHFARRDVPVGRAGNARVIQVAILVAPGALHADHTVIVRSASHGRLMRRHLHALQRHITARMTVRAPRVEQDSAGLEKECRERSLRSESTAKS